MIRRKNDITEEKIEGPFNGGGIAVRKQLIQNNTDLCDKGRLFNHMILEPGAAIGYHEHNGDSELYYILTGKGVYNDNGTDEQVEAGDLTIVKSGEGHSLKNTGSEPMTLIALVVYA